MNKCKACGSDIEVDATTCPHCGAEAFTDSTWDAAARAELPDEDFGQPDTKSFPIRTSKDVEDATHLIGHAKDPVATKSRIISIAKRKGLAIPPGWADAMKSCPQCMYAISSEATRCPYCGVTLPPENAIPSVVAAKVAGQIDTEVAVSGVLVSGVDAFTDDVLDENTKFTVLLNDSKKYLMRVRHLATRADAVNGNNRIYPREVLTPAIDAANTVAQAGGMVAEREHPEIVKRRSGEDGYVDNPTRKTAINDHIHYPDRAGDVYLDRSILNTPEGRKIAAAYKNNNPVGLSMRFQADMTGRGLSDGRQVAVAKQIIIHNFDDVDNPAVADTRKPRSYETLTDSLKEELGLPPDTKAKRTKEMNKFQRALNAYNLAISNRAGVDELNKARALCMDAITELASTDADTTEVTTKLTAADAGVASCGAMVVPGYQVGKPGPTVISIKDYSPPGFAPEIEAGGTAGNSNMPKDKGNANGEQSGDAIAAAVQAALDNNPAIKAAQAAADAKAIADAKATLNAAIDSKAQAHAEFAKLTADEQAFVLNNLHGRSDVTADDIDAKLDEQIDAISKLTAKAKLDAMGVNRPSNAHGQSTHNPADPANNGGTFRGQNNSPGLRLSNATITREANPAMAEVNKILAASDAAKSHNLDFLSMPKAERDRRRAYNRIKLQPIIDDFFKLHKEVEAGGTHRAAAFAAAIDCTMGDGNPDKIAKVLKASTDSLNAATDTQTISAFYNQPYIATALFIEQFQDLDMFKWVAGIGPSMQTENNDGWASAAFNNGKGPVFRFPSEFFVQPGPQDYGYFGGNIYQGGYLTPENVGITPITIGTSWQTFVPMWRWLAASFTRQAAVAMGNGPLNYDILGREMYHMTFAKNRAIDKALGDGMLQASDEFGAVAVAGESVNLTDNGVYLAGGGVTVNLNPAKLASAPVVTATDAFMTYGSNVIAAVRLTGGTTPQAGGYFGGVWGATPVVQPRTIVDFNSQGAITNTVINPFTVTLPANAVIGFIDENGGNKIQTLPGGGAAATCAVDWQNSVLVFASGVSGSSNTLSTAVTVTYSYATNFVAFNAYTGVTYDTKTTGDALLGEHDVLSAALGSSPNFVKPNLALCSLNASTLITRASLFYKFNSPDGTELFPTEDHYYQRNGVRGGRHNTPWYGGDKRLLFTVEDSTKYAIDTPFEAFGPYPGYDGSGNVTPAVNYIAGENSAIFTPEPQNANNVVINHVSETVLLY